MQTRVRRGACAPPPSTPVPARPAGRLFFPPSKSGALIMMPIFTTFGQLFNGWLSLIAPGRCYLSGSYTSPLVVPVRLIWGPAIMACRSSDGNTCTALHLGKQRCRSRTLPARRKGQLHNLWLSERWMLFVGGYIDLSSCLIMKTPGGRIIYAAAVPSDPLVDRQAIILKTSAICNRVIIPFAR